MGQACDVWYGDRPVSNLTPFITQASQQDSAAGIAHKFAGLTSLRLVPGTNRNAKQRNESLPEIREQPAAIALRVIAYISFLLPFRSVNKVPLRQGYYADLV